MVVEKPWATSTADGRRVAHGLRATRAAPVTMGVNLRQRPLLRALQESIAHGAWSEWMLLANGRFQERGGPSCTTARLSNFSLLKHSLETSLLRSYTRGEL